MKFRPLHDRVVVKRIDAEEKTAGGIIIPDTAKEKPSQGEIFVAATGADGDYLALARLLFGGVRDNDATGSLFLGVDALDDYAVVKRAELHGSPPQLLNGFAVWVAGVPLPAPG